MAGSSFKDLMDNLGELGQVASRVTTAVAEDINGFLAVEFVAEVDPYGDPWAPNAESTVRRKGHDVIMFETGQTGRETRAFPMRGAGIEIRSTEQAGYNQFERENAPARPVLPSRADLPKLWSDAIEQRFDEAVGSAMSGGKGKKKK